MRLPAAPTASTIAVLFSFLPVTQGSFVFPTNLVARSVATMASSSDNGNNVNDSIERQSYKPVHVYPYSADLESIKATGQYVKLKRFHVIRHAEGTHNVNREYRDIINLDARLTDLGKEQCQSLAEKLAKAAAGGSPSKETDNSEDESYHRIIKYADLVVTSPLTRCLQTALLSFPTLAETPTKEAANNKKKTKVPFVAHESIRETVNYACDRRRPISSLEPHYHERICFEAIEHDHDELWESYVRRLGSTEEYDNHRESAELHAVADRARDFFTWVKERKEQDIVVCTHSAFLRCILSWGQAGGVPMMMPQVLEERGGGDVGDNNSEIFMVQNLDDRQATADGKDVVDVPVFQYCGDSIFEEYMRRDYENCELRSFLVAFPAHD